MFHQGYEILPQMEQNNDNRHNREGVMGDDGAESGFLKRGRHRDIADAVEHIVGMIGKML